MKDAGAEVPAEPEEKEEVVRQCRNLRVVLGRQSFKSKIHSPDVGCYS